MSKISISKIFKKRKLQYIFIFIITTTTLLGLVKLSSGSEQSVYVKVKVSQGLWWANTTNPYIWLAKNIKKGDIEKDLLGNPIAEIIEVRKYPTIPKDLNDKDNYSIFIKVKINSKLNKRTKQYIHNRSPLIAGSPIELNFSNINLTGTIIEVSPQPIVENRKDIIIEYVSTASYTYDYPYIYENIGIGDKYYDGEQIVFEVLDKLLKGITVDVTDDQAGLYTRYSGTIRNIVVKAKISVIEQNGVYIFGEERIISTSNPLYISTKNLSYKGFVVADIIDENPSQ